MAHIGIMGGTFDPIHNGHLLLGRQAYREYALDQVWYMPSGQPPHKRGRPVTSVRERCEMVQLAVRDTPRFHCSEFEAQRPGITYSSETLGLLCREYPQDRFYFIIGADSFFEIEKWHHPWEVMRLAALLVAVRSYHSVCTMEEQAAMLKEKYRADIHFLHCERLDISSSELRRMVSEGKDIRPLVPGAVESYIRSRGLYRNISP